MDKILKNISLVLLLITAMTFVSCDEDERVDDDGYFKVGEVSYNLNHASLEDIGYENGYYQLRLSFDNTVNNDMHKLNFLVYSEVNTYLPSAKYTPYLYDENYQDTFKRGAWMIGDVEAGVFVQGYMKSTKSNDIYTIHIDCTDMDGNQVVGEYKGRIQLIN